MSFFVRGGVAGGDGWHELESKHLLKAFDFDQDIS